MSKTKRLVLLALLTTLLFVQEEVLSFLPNIQLTVFLIVLYSKTLGLKDTVLIVTAHVILDNLVFGSFSPVYTPFMFIGWCIIPVMLNTVFKNVNESLQLAFCGALFALLYSWVYVIPSCIVFEMNFFNYMKADFIFEVLLALSSFISILWLYQPCEKVLKQLLK